MTQNVVVNWAATRSEKWRRQLGGLETMLAPIDGPLIDALALDLPLRIADVACGSGATTVEVLRRAPAGSVVHGFDLSPALIEVARRRRGARDGSAAFTVADIAIMPPPAQPYDRLISRLGVMFFAHPEAAFVNLRRWLRPGGRFAFAVWASLEDNVWMSFTQAAVADAIDLAVPAPSAPGPFRYGDAAPLASLLVRAGFADVQVADWRHPLPIGNGGGAPEAARFALAAFSSFAELLAAAGVDARARAQASLTARFTPYARNGVVRMPARIHIVTGRAVEPAPARAGQTSRQVESQERS